MGNATAMRRKNHRGEPLGSWAGTYPLDLDKTYAPLFQRGIGFERMFDVMNRALKDLDGGSGYPPYDIVQTGENHYNIDMALAGFGPDEIHVELENGLLTIEGEKAQARTDGNNFLHRGIANRKFVHRFRLADHIRVEEASLKQGILSIRLIQEVPEALKPRKIEVRLD